MSDAQQYPHLEDLVRDASIATATEQVGRLILRAEVNHNRRRDQLQQVITLGKEGNKINFEGDDPLTLMPGTDLHKGFVLGVEIAHHMMGEFPIRFRNGDVDEEDEDED